jgi:precorrin-6A/cobalt-precorrin-6A reductase
MHGGPLDQTPGQRLWLFSGTGDGPPLVRELLQQGWQLCVSVVTAEASRPYNRHPRLELRVGPLGGSEALRLALEAAQRQGRPFTAVIDATHPFATQIQRQLQVACQQAGVPLLGLARQSATGLDPQPPVTWLERLEDLASAELAGARLLLAIGARHLALAVHSSPGAVHHARLLPRPAALQLALAAGLDPGRLACLQPLALASGVEAALVRRWRIEAIVARQSGPPTERLWRRIAAEQGCRLLLLRQPQPLATARRYSHLELLAQLAAHQRRQIHLGAGT